MSGRFRIFDPKTFARERSQSVDVCGFFFPHTRHPLSRNKSVCASLDDDPGARARSLSLSLSREPACLRIAVPARLLILERVSPCRFFSSSSSNGAERARRLPRDCELQLDCVPCEPPRVNLALEDGDELDSVASSIVFETEDSVEDCEEAPVTPRTLDRVDRRHTAPQSPQKWDPLVRREGETANSFCGRLLWRSVATTRRDTQPYHYSDWAKLFKRCDRDGSNAARVTL